MFKNSAKSNALRVPSQQHLKLLSSNAFHEFPVQFPSGGLVESYLDRLYKVINAALADHKRVYAVRVDLHLPKTYHSIDGLLVSNELLNRFIKALRGKLKRYKTERTAQGIRIHNVGFKYVWAREEGAESDRPHFHLLLLFNGNAFRGLGSFIGGGENLCSRLRESWALALGLHPAEGGCLVHFPENGQYEVKAGDQNRFEQLFFRASYLTKAATKSFRDGVHVFGSSQI